MGVVAILLEHRADVAASMAQGNTALHYAAAGGHADCCAAILACHAVRTVPRPLPRARAPGLRPPAPGLRREEGCTALVGGGRR